MAQLHWEPTDVFTLDGTEFSILHNGLQAIMNSPVYQEHFQIAKNVAVIGQLFEMSSKKLQDGITAGTVKEVADVVPESSSVIGHEMD